MIARRKKSLKLDVSNLGTAFPTVTAHPADASRSNLAAALALLSGVTAFQTRLSGSLSDGASLVFFVFSQEEAIWPFSDMLGSGNEELPSMTDAWSTLSACLPGTATLQACMPSSPMNFSPSTMVRACPAHP
jgi:hypothetical protein